MPNVKRTYSRAFLQAALLFTGLSLTQKVFSQQSIAVTIGAGLCGSPGYDNMLPGPFVNANLNYFFKPIHALYVDYFSGRQQHNDLTQSNIDPDIFTLEKRTGSATYRAIAVGYKGIWLNNKKTTSAISLGLAHMRTKEYWWFDEGSRTVERSYLQGGRVGAHIAADIRFRVFKQFSIGVMAGSYFLPDVHAQAIHAGATLTYGFGQQAQAGNNR